MENLNISILMNEIKSILKNILQVILGPDVFIIKFYQNI